MIQYRNAALAICEARIRIRAEQQSRSECNRAIVLTICRQRIAAEQAVRSLRNRNIALARLVEREAIAKSYFKN
jgi:hypothetical protein